MVPKKKSGRARPGDSAHASDAFEPLLGFFVVGKTTFIEAKGARVVIPPPFDESSGMLYV
jgi:hypothetical protein